ncbi:hypothetical protein jhhlp_004354 [Lomentospora prolificans]|uniref:RecA family profile 1 domain-containing protein n=1 Tax=Lomentospora prolificans TaxID=41688 RepID=A0A2N3NBC7_9PEZI|nr:hypothetical protein jhhlp_004354 [Lomentospora prolificans]
MTDLLRLLPDFPAGPFSRLLHVLDNHGITTTDLLTLDASDLGSRTKLPVLDLKRLSAAVLDALHRDLSVLPSRTGSSQEAQERDSSKKSLDELCNDWSTISTLDDSLDAALGGGVPTGYVTEITGESGAGKTQFLLSLLLAVQLPPPHGLSRSALYISTESPLSTRRLAQMLSANPLIKRLDPERRPTLDNILSTVTADLESQDHILQFQVPVEVERRNVGLIVLDSVAANYRAEFERGASRSSYGSNMGTRSNELIRLGAHLRELARKYNLAVVVANQVADRFSSSLPLLTSSTMPLTSSIGVPTQESPLASRTKRVAFDAEEPLIESQYAPPSTPPEASVPPALLLDHQQRWFTGWGDDPYADYVLKTPSLGLVWSTQIACRIALFRKPIYGIPKLADEDGADGRPIGEEDGDRFVPTQTGWKRWMKVVFAPHAQASGQGLAQAVRYEVTMGGLRALESPGEEVGD